MYFINDNVLQRLAQLIDNFYVDKDGKIKLSDVKSTDIKLTEIKSDTKIDDNFKSLFEMIYEIIKIPYNFSSYIDKNSNPFILGKYLLITIYKKYPNRFANKIENIDEIKNLEIKNKNISEIISHILNNIDEYNIEIKYNKNVNVNFYFINGNVLQRISNILHYNTILDNGVIIVKNKIDFEPKLININFDNNIKSSEKLFDYIKNNIINIPYDNVVTEKFKKYKCDLLAKILLYIIFITEKNKFFNEIENIDQINSKIEIIWKNYLKNKMKLSKNENKKFYEDKKFYENKEFINFLIKDILINFKINYIDFIYINYTLTKKKKITKNNIITKKNNIITKKKDKNFFIVNKNIIISIFVLILIITVVAIVVLLIWYFYFRKN